MLYFTSARDIWKDLEERYYQNSGVQLYSIQQTLHELPQGNTAISEFFTEIKALWDQLSGMNLVHVCTCARCTCNITQKIVKQQ